MKRLIGCPQFVGKILLPRVDFTHGVILASYCCIEKDNFDRKHGLLLRVEEHRTRHQNGMDKRITLMGLLSFFFAADDIYEPKPTSFVVSLGVADFCVGMLDVFS